MTAEPTKRFIAVFRFPHRELALSLRWVWAAMWLRNGARQELHAD
jgi:hypothetical protein